jgi:hypothetical protein
MSSSFLSLVRDILLGLEASFIFDQVVAMVKINRTLSWHLLALNF